MEESWNQLQSLELHLKEQDGTFKKSTDSSIQGKLLSMAKDIKDRDREILSLKGDIASLEIYKDQCSNMQTQIKLLREKIVIHERESQSKSTILSSLESNTFPKLEKLDSDLKLAIQNNEKLQKSYNQTKKDNEDKLVLITKLKQTCSGQEAAIKSLEEEKRNLKIKFSEIQNKIEDLAKQQEKSIESLKNKEDLSLALEEDNDRLRSQIENTMESLQKCQYELSLLPKLKQEIYQREQLISAASKEIDKEKSLKNKAIEEKENTEMQLANIFECTDGNDPAEYIQRLKALLNKTAKDQSDANENIMILKENQRSLNIENAQSMNYISEYLQNVSKIIAEEFMGMRVMKFPEIEPDFKSVLHGVCDQIEKTQISCRDKIIEIQEVNQLLSERIAQLQKDIPLWQRVEDMENLIQKQETLSSQLTEENIKIKKELEIRNKDLHLSEQDKHDLIKELEALEQQKILIENQLEAFQISHENLLKDHKNLINQTAKKDELNKSLEESNQQLLKQIENTMDSLEKCQRELSYIPKLKQEIHTKEQMLLAGTRELEKLKQEILSRDQVLNNVSKDIDKIQNETHSREQAFSSLNREMDKMKFDLINKENFIVKLTKKVNKKKLIIEDFKARVEDMDKQLIVIQKLTEDKNPVEYIEELKICKESLNMVIIPKLKLDIEQKDQDIKVLGCKLDEIKEKVTKEQALVTELCEGKNLEIYVNELKSGMNKYAKDLEKAHGETVEIKEQLKKIETDSLNSIGYISSYIKGISKYLVEEFFSSETLTFPKIDENHRSTFQKLCSNLIKLKKISNEKLTELRNSNEELKISLEESRNLNESTTKKLQDTQTLNENLNKKLQEVQSLNENINKKFEESQNLNESLNKKQQKLEENPAYNSDIGSQIIAIARKKMEENEGLIQKQEFLLDQLSSENYRLKQALELTTVEHQRSEKEKQDLLDELELMNDKKDLVEKKLTNLDSRLQGLRVEHEKAINHLRGKDELIIELESNNDKLRMQIQATVGSLEKYQSDLGIIPMLKQEIINKEQQYMAAVREIEKYKESSKSLIKKIDKLEGQLDLMTRDYGGQDSIEFHESRSRELHLRKLEYQLAEIYKETDNEDPVSFIQDLKSIHASLGMSK
ncbi:hypothetical protein SteCoe_7856 [Stentor coeruleus]|uniref:Uncharacterized protein n=1 Tax=Stentor coeruleus TaxID=5963 RepID=A0A1R2CLK8_9CILI|nr:hypothetical protein SteCoe_7856 [Stentor coeruleus]